jgi:hypothetical protein
MVTGPVTTFDGTVTVKFEIPLLDEMKFAVWGPPDPEKFTVAAVVVSDRENFRRSPGKPALIERSVVGSIIGTVLVSVAVPAACACDVSKVGKAPENVERRRATRRIFEAFARNPITLLSLKSATSVTRGVPIWS